MCGDDNNDSFMVSIASVDPGSDNTQEKEKLKIEILCDNFEIDGEGDIPDPNLVPTPQKKFQKEKNLTKKKNSKQSGNINSTSTKSENDKNLPQGTFGVLPPNPPTNVEVNRRRSDVLGQHSFKGVDGKQSYFNLKVCHAVLCCAVLFCVLLCCVTWSCAVLCCIVLCCVMLCHVRSLHIVILCSMMSSQLHYVIFYNVMSCFLHSVSYVMYNLCHVIL